MKNHPVILRVVLFIQIVILTAGSFSQPLYAFDGKYDSEYYGSNDILFYNPEDAGCTVSGTGSGTLVGNSNTEKILRFLVGKDLSIAQASGIIGNIKKESGAIPEKIQGGKLVDKDYPLTTGDGFGKVGFGIVQWTTSGRQQGLANLAKSSNRDITDLSLQLDYLWQELNGGYKKALTSLKTINNPVDAAIDFEDKYEQSADSDEVVRNIRGGFAQQTYDGYNSSVPDNTTDSNPKTDKNKGESVATKTITCTGSGKASAFVDGFAIYNQNDPQWNDKSYGSSTIGEAGCGPAAMAMAITALTGQTVTPDQAAEFAENNNIFVDGRGSSHQIVGTLSEHWGLKAEGITNPDSAKINEILRSNGLVIAVANGDAPYTSLGHFIVIRAVKENGMLLVGDSNGLGGGMANSAKEWDPSSILVNGVTMWAVTK